MEPTKALMASFLLLFFFFNIHPSAQNPPPSTVSGHRHHQALRRLQALKASHVRFSASGASSPSPSPSPSRPPPSGSSGSRVYLATSYGADPTGKLDSTEALLAAIADAANGHGEGFLMDGISNLGGAQLDLQGGNYLISRPLRLPVAGVGNFMIHGGTIRASDSFPSGGYLIDLSTNINDKTAPPSSYNYEFLTFKDLLLDSNFHGGGIFVINSLRIGIDNCYVTHFTTNGILVQGGHETYIRNSFIGQHITAGGDKGERNFTGIGINLQGNDNSVTDVVIFSAAIGIMIFGQANIISGVHCYNKATGFGGTGIYLKLAGLTQTRVLNSYMDYTSIVAEDPVQLHISGTFFLGDANVVLKSINGVVSGVNIVDNMFSGSDHGVEIVHLDQSGGKNFKQVDQVVVDSNVVEGMKLKSTVAKKAVQGNGTSLMADFNDVLLFPNLIKHVQYSLSFDGDTFPSHVLRNVSDNRVVIQTSEAVPASLYVAVDQGI
ncbi:polygalacturonase QRT3 [Prosopis cineraria]|uniref:polygalacturonase QRT3 n=1 Tax=Prosopis cineraria TaxID=364024 RepID=UPI00241085DB|nr:polygalacturonase QRT3 [Prosopis cineraria]